MHRGLRTFAAGLLPLSVMLALALAPENARAQLSGSSGSLGTSGSSGTSGTLTTTSGPTITASGQVNPDRLVNGVVVQPRAQNLTPTGVNYSDCINDMVLRFTVTASGFDGGESIGIWGTRSGDCSADTARGVGSVTGATCWLLGTALGEYPVVTSPATVSVDIRVQDLVGPQNEPPFPPTYHAQNSAACATQSSSAAVPMDIWFVPVKSSGYIDGTAYDYGIPTDLVGPAPPAGVSEQVGDTLMNVSWTPNGDSDTAGYDIYIDPTPGTPVYADASSVTYVCPDASDGAIETGTPGATTTVNEASAGVDSAIASGATDGSNVSEDATNEGAIGDAMNEGAAGDATDDGAAGDAVDNGALATDATMASGAPDAGTATPTPSGPSCSNHGGSSGTDASFTTCTSAIDTLYIGSNAVNSTGLSSTTTTSTTTDDSGVVTTDDATTSSGSGGTGGISLIPSGNLIGVNAGFTISDKTSGAYTITGLTNGVTYNVVVSAVDGSGNIGPPSGEVCDYPAPVLDFFQAYRAAGGLAGGGFCALEGVGLPTDSAALLLGVGAAALSLARRRRRRE